MKKIAILISGPERYLKQVLDNISSIFEGVDYDNYIFLWDEPNDNRGLSKETVNNDIIYITSSKVFLKQKPFDEKFINDTFGSEVLGHSSKKAMMGMFYSIAILTKVLRFDPEFESYTHVLRIRTDCVLFNKKFLLEYNNKDILVANNPLIPSNWVSDHIMFCRTKEFLKIWDFNALKNTNLQFKLASNNPELLLRLRTIFINGRVVKKFQRFLDYHIVYDNNDKEPGYARKLMPSNSHYLFSDFPSENVRVEYYESKIFDRANVERYLLNRLKSSLIIRFLISVFGK